MLSIFSVNFWQFRSLDFNCIIFRTFGLDLEGAFDLAIVLVAFVRVGPSYLQILHFKILLYEVEHYRRLNKRLYIGLGQPCFAAHNTVIEYCIKNLVHTYLSRIYSQDRSVNVSKRDSFLSTFVELNERKQRDDFVKRSQVVVMADQRQFVLVDLLELVEKNLDEGDPLHARHYPTAPVAEDALTKSLCAKDNTVRTNYAHILGRVLIH
jgi:hypothetical protein